MKRMFFGLVLVALAFRLFAAGESDVDLSLREVMTTAREGQRVRTSGTVTDAFSDDVDLRYAFLIIQDDGFTLPVAMLNSPITNLRAMVDARVSVAGLYCECLYDDSDRKFANPFLRLDVRNGLKVLVPPPGDPFDFPPLEQIVHVSPYKLSLLGKRKIRGSVLAAWGRNHVLIRDETRRIVKAELSDGQPLPHPGEGIAVVGYPATDQFTLNLRHCLWKAAPDAARPVPAPRPIPIRQMIFSRDGMTKFDADHIGTAVRLTGIVRSLPNEGEADGRATVDCDGVPILLDRGIVSDAFSGLVRDSVIRFSGICAIDTRDWSPDDIFPRIQGIAIVIRDRGDIEILARPSWWTVRRLACVALTLLVALAAIFVWNRALNRLVAKRTRQLFGEELARMRAELRTRERTHLAVELHDAISQNLTGVALEMDAADRLAKDGPTELLPHLEHARQALRSCREELRNCLWDLRNDTLGARRMDDAIRQTLTPHVGDATLEIDFGVSRRKFSDTSMHSILHIVRELATNAVRHGNAKTIRVSGRIEDGNLRLSVADDGCGFDPQGCPGPLQGHFGLQGIRERVEGLDGAFAIASTPGSGTVAEIVLDLSAIRQGEEQP